MFSSKSTGGVRMNAIIEQKQKIVAEISEKLTSSQSTVVVDYRGLTVAEVTELRKQLREAGVEFKVYKNSMTRRAAESAELSALNESLTQLKMLLRQQKSLTILRKNMKR
jgi:large subunit ribosomal protein L10